MKSFLEKTNIIHKTQSGFRENNSCNTALIRLTNAGIRKAFDLIYHKILEHKLKSYHFSPLTLKLFKSYLENRTQMLQVGNINSETLPMPCCVPQGTTI